MRVSKEQRSCRSITEHSSTHNATEMSVRIRFVIPAEVGIQKRIGCHSLFRPPRSGSHRYDGIAAGHLFAYLCAQMHATKPFLLNMDCVDYQATPTQLDQFEVVHIK